MTEARGRSGLALAKFTRFSSWGVAGAPGSKATDLQETADLLRPWIKHARAHRRRPEDALRATCSTTSVTFAAQKDEDVAACRGRPRAILLDAGCPQPDRPGVRPRSMPTRPIRRRATLLQMPARWRRPKSLETRSLFSMAEKVLVQASRRPAVDGESGAGRRTCSERLAIRRHDYGVATRLRREPCGAEAGESYVRFNPSDLNSWALLGTLASTQVAGFQRAGGTGP